jgi:hypothetical protein
MKQDRITKLYEGLTAKEQATLAFNCITSANTTEAERIAAAVPMRSYRMLDADYLRWIRGFTNMASCWGVLYWRTLAGEQAARLLVLSGSVGDAQKWMDGCTTLQKQLAGLEGALLAVCSVHGIDPNTVRRLAGDAEPMDSEVEADSDYQAETEGWLNELLNGTQKTVNDK